jgi:ketosteroid isomerase-like protein
MPSDSEIHSQVHQVLERFNELVSTKNPQVLDEFAPGDDVLLIGSDAGEVARGRRELQAFFTRIFARENTFSWEWDHLDVSHSGNIAWFFAEGRAVLTTAQKQRKAPYRISGILERPGARWLWRQYHGSEPVTGG